MVLEKECVSGPQEMSSWFEGSRQGLLSIPKTHWELVRNQVQSPGLPIQSLLLSPPPSFFPPPLPHLPPV